MVRAAQDHDDARHLDAMNRCISGYWKPVFYFLRAHGYRVHQAEDLTQEFFLQFFQRDWIDRADSQRGRFRTFLLTVLTRFLADQGPKRAPRQKTFDDGLVSVSTLLTDEERSFEPPTHETPEQAFMKRWAHAVLDKVKSNLQAWCQCRSRPEWYEIFLANYFPASDAPRVTQQILADHFGLTRDQVRYALEEVNRQFVEFLGCEVCEQVDSPEEIEDEIHHLQRLLSI
jgi:RNA polymerase sigma factor (sigma-70 family)